MVLHSKKRLLMMAVLSTTMPFSFAGISENADLLVTSFLESYNQIDGIELLGGPFELSEYTTGAQVDSHIENQYIHFRYRSTDLLKGWPSNFSVWTYSGMHFPLSMSIDPVKISEEAQKTLIQYGVIIDELPNLVNLLAPTSMTIVQIDLDDNVIREDAEINSINRVAKCEENTICIFYNEGYNSSLFRSLLSTRNFILSDIEDIGNVNKEATIDNVADISLPRQHILLFGQIKDENLLSLIKKHYQEHPDFKILAIEITSKNQALLYEGDVGVITKWLINRPIAMAVLEKNECWKISKTIEILNINEYFVDFPIQLFPLTSKLDKDQLLKLKEDVVIESELKEEEVLELLHYVYRLRGLSNNILSIKDIGNMEVEIRVGSFGSGSGIKFKKVDNKWLLKDYYEYVR